MSKMTDAQREEMRALLRKRIRPGAVLYTVVTHVAKSGMMRHIKVLQVRSGEIHNISRMVADALGRKFTDDNAVVSHGCGMDMGFELIYCLGRALFPKGGSLAKTSYVRQHQAKKGGIAKEIDGGYLLVQQWL